MNKFTQYALIAVPCTFLIGLTLREYVTTASAEETFVAKLVAQRLGTWTPPALSPEDRAALVLERELAARSLQDLERARARRRRVSDERV
jgi:hypothetical protein